jgi:hypothetical protein
VIVGGFLESGLLIAGLLITVRMHAAAEGVRSSIKTESQTGFLKKMGLNQAR